MSSEVMIHSYFSLSLTTSPGLPYFSVEPQHMSVVANVRMSLQCTAHGPPEPVWVIWLQDGAPLNKLDDPISLSPSTFTISGINVSQQLPHTQLEQYNTAH